MVLRNAFRTLILLSIVSPIARADDRRYPFQKKVLDNGLTVISLEDHSCPIVAVQIWYHVGSKDEDPERQGFAHMFEHMMFRGTDRLGPEDHFTYVRQTGGECNAYTSFDNTTYINQLPSNQLALALWLEAERMAFLTIDDDSFYKERAVVEEERRLRSLNTPYGTVPEKLMPVIFEKHPYQWTPIGQIPHLRAATIDELQAFWDKYYVPNNATLIVVGDTTHARVQKLAEQYFGWIPRSPDPPRVTIVEPPQTAQRHITIPEKKGPVPIVGLVYRGVAQRDADALPLEMLMNIVGGGESSRIYQDLVKEQKIAEVAVGGAFSLEDDGLCGAGAVLMPWGNQEKVLTEIRAHLDRVKKEKVSPRELEKARNQFLRSEVTQSLTAASKARMLGQYELFHGGAESLNKRLGRIRSITADDLLRVANKYLVTERETVAIVKPQLAKNLLGKLFGRSKEDDVDEGAAPPVKPEVNRVAKRGPPRSNLTRPAGFPDTPPVADLIDSMPATSTHTRLLGNNLKVVVIENHEVPFVTMTMAGFNGSWTEEKPGMASMACALITQGSANHTAAEMAEELEFNAISLGASASMDGTTINASCVSDKVDRAMKLLAEAVLTPTFPQAEFNIAKSQTLLGLMIQSATPEYQADRVLRQKIYGDHPYARTPTGEQSDVNALTPELAKQWWSRYVRPETSVLYIAGDVSPEKMLDLAEAQFGGWKSETPPQLRRLPRPPPPAPTHIYIVDRPGSVQSQIRIAHTSITRDSKDYFVSRTLSQIFGGGFNSRLNSAVRVERGLTYGARGGISARRFLGTMGISTFTKTPTTAETLKVLLDEIDRIKASAVEDDELARAKSYAIGSFTGRRETPQALVRDLWMIESNGLPEDYFTRYLDGVKRTTKDDVLRVAKNLFLRDKLTIVVVGEADKIKANLEKLAPVTVVESVEATASKPAEESNDPAQ